MCVSTGRPTKTKVCNTTEYQDTTSIQGNSWKQCQQLEIHYKNLKCACLIYSPLPPEEFIPGTTSGKRANTCTNILSPFVFKKKKKSLKTL